MSDLFSVLSMIFIAVACFLYFIQIAKEQSTPNPVTWLIFAMIGIINAVTYVLVVDSDFFKSMTVIVHSSLLVLICLYTFFTWKFTRIRLFDVFCLVLVSSVGAFYVVYRDYDRANILVQIVSSFAFVPTIYGLQKARAREKALSWHFSVLSYAFLVVSVITDPEGQSWVAYVFPVLRGILCVIVILIILRQRKNGVLGRI